MSQKEELVVLVDEKDNPVGTMSKAQVHGRSTPLHRGFSVFLFNDEGKVLVQRRALSKQTWPGVWSNSCCGHPLPDESYEDAVKRRVKYELGCGVKDLRKVSDYRYRFERFGVVENEICPVFVGKIENGEVRFNLDEVEEVDWFEWEEFKRELKSDKEDKWSEWCKEEVGLVEKHFLVLDIV